MVEIQLRRVAADLLARTTVSQGRPVVIDDPAVLARCAVLMRPVSPAEPRARGKGRQHAA